MIIYILLAITFVLALTFVFYTYGMMHTEKKTNPETVTRNIEALFALTVVAAAVTADTFLVFC